MEQIKFQVLTVTGMKMAVFWKVVSCSVRSIDRRFEGPYCFNYQAPDDGGRKYL
jgi:hypothetical protein